ncbi:MAG TPA: metalloregulator ArsR/SmtB family transcription factor [Sedimentisphaerales bacterium]|nr:metalloregulator ArsR/SmtB family transcription factor [Sedimentisphaerales bacterium]
MRDFINIAKALADENRVRALMMLCEGELCVCQLIEMLALAPSTVSKHMSILFQAGLLNARKQGRWMYYRLADDPPTQALQAIRWVRNSLAEDKQIVADARQVKRVWKMDKDKLCACYKKGKPEAPQSRRQKLRITGAPKTRQKAGSK